MRIKLAALLTAIVAIAFGLVALAGSTPRAAGAEQLPEMCNGRSDPSTQVITQASGQQAGIPKYFLDVSSNAAGKASGTLIMSLGAQRLVVNDWCRLWQHLPGQPSQGNCGMTYPEGAITAHAVGETKFNGQDLLVRTDVRKLASGQMLFRVRYRPLAADESSTGDDCETGWTKVPAEGWDPLGTFHVQAPADQPGYWLGGADGGTFNAGAPFDGSLAGTHLNQPIVGMTADPSTGGYWLVGADGGVFTFGDAPFYGSLAGVTLNKPIVGMAEDPPTNGYWLVAADGGVFTFGDAPFYGSLASKQLNAPVVGMAGDPATGSYWLVAADGGVFTFGDAAFYGSLASRHLNAPVVGMIATPSGAGYWLVAADGGVFTFGDAAFYGSLASRHLNAPVVGMIASPSGAGYWLVAADGGVFTFGDAQFYGSTAGIALNRPVVGMATGW